MSDERSITWQVLRRSQQRRMEWRNGGGVTYEVASSPPGAGLADFDWRVSIAEVEAGGPFSVFPDIDRTIVLVEGEWMALTVGGRRHRFGVGEPFAFDGGSETTCEVPRPSRDLNVMTRRGRATAEVSILDPVERGRASPVRGVLAVVCLTAPVRLVDGQGTGLELGTLDAAVSDDPSPLQLDGDGSAALIRLAVG